MTLYWWERNTHNTGGTNWCKYYWLHNYYQTQSLWRWANQVHILQALFMWPRNKQVVNFIIISRCQFGFCTEMNCTSYGTMGEFIPLGLNSFTIHITKKNSSKMFMSHNVKKIIVNLMIEYSYSAIPKSYLLVKSKPFKLSSILWGIKGFKVCWRRKILPFQGPINW